MASRSITSGGASALPLNLLAQAIPMLTRNELARLTERLIEHLDSIDGDPDEEDDDPVGQCDEDAHNTNLLHRFNEGPGCVISEGGGV